MYYIYVIQNVQNLKIYVGRSKHRKRSRWTEHLRLSRSNNPAALIHKAIRKHGAKNFTFQIIEQFERIEDVLDAEKFWICYFRSNVCKFGPDSGYNLTDGADGKWSHKVSEKTKAKISKTLKGRYPAIARDALKQKGFPRKLNVCCKIAWPEDKELITLVKDLGFVQAGKRLGVSNVAIKGRLIRRHLYPFT